MKTKRWADVRKERPNLLKYVNRSILVCESMLEAVKSAESLEANVISVEEVKSWIDALNLEEMILTRKKRSDRKQLESPVKGIKATQET